MLFVENTSFDPHFNQAFEEYVFDRAEPGEEILMLWRNDPAVVCGCYQNVYAEVDLPRAAELGVAVVRRESGGGAVYHDRGNVNYTFIAPAGDAGADYARFIQPVARALNALGVPARMNRTCDIAVDGLKVSGSAQKIRKGRVLHHGTLLYDADLSRLRELTRGERGRVVTKGVRSSPWPVTNMRACLPPGSPDTEAFMAALRELLAPGAASARLSAEEKAAVERLAESKYRAWEWTCGRSPAFEREGAFPMGAQPVPFSYAARKGVVERIAFDADLPALREAARRLTGARLEAAELRARLAGLDGLDAGALIRELF